MTLRDLQRISEAFRFSLQNILHTRIAYPEEKPREQKDARESGRGGASPAHAA
ncbi:MAG: hypothetical protein HC774_05245 [Sphingomonadales bacterium]|nr:hypothetical protein [Sphingomonadales bacterium]